MSSCSFRWPERPSGLYRDPEHGKVAGVCAGLGRYFQVRPKFIRLAMIMGCVFGLFIPIVVGYILLTVLLPIVPDGAANGPPSHADHSGSDRWRGGDAGTRIDGLKDRFRSLDQRLAAIEARVTSEEFQLRQKFRDL